METEEKSETFPSLFSSLKETRVMASSGMTGLDGSSDGEHGEGLHGSSAGETDRGSELDYGRIAERGATGDTTRANAAWERILDNRSGFWLARAKKKDMVQSASSGTAADDGDAGDSDDEMLRFGAHAPGQAEAATRRRLIAESDMRCSRAKNQAQGCLRLVQSYQQVIGHGTTVGIDLTQPVDTKVVWTEIYVYTHYTCVYSTIYYNRRE